MRCGLLCVVLMMILVGSLAGGAELRVATFRCDVTPPPGGHPLIWLTPVAEVEDPLLAKGIVLDDGRQRYVLCAVDWCGLGNSSNLLFRSKIAAAADTDLSHVAVHCVHQHTAPYTDGDAQKLLDGEKDPPRYVDFKFLEEVTDRLAAIGVAFARRIERPLELNLLQIGDVRIAHLPGECMVEFQLFAQRLVPEGFVAVAAYGDLGPGYICTEQSFPEGGYEPTASEVAPKSEGALKDALRLLLEGK